MTASTHLDELLRQFTAPLASIPPSERIDFVETMAKKSRHSPIPLFKRRATVSAFKELAMCYRLEAKIENQGEHPDLRRDLNHHHRRLRSALSAVPDLTLVDLYSALTSAALAMITRRAPAITTPTPPPMQSVLIKNSTPSPGVEGEAFTSAGRLETYRDNSGKRDTLPTALHPQSPVKTPFTPRSGKPVAKKSGTFRDTLRDRD